MLHSTPGLKARHVFVAFWVAYLMSYLFRTINAVVSPELTRDLGLAPGTLGLLTSAYFVAFAAVQLPAGVLLDRFGPRRVEPVLLAVGGAGVRKLFAHPRLWWIAPLAGSCTGAFFAIQGLWSVPWLTEVNGYDRGEAAQHLFVMGVFMLAGYLGLGLFATRLARFGIGPRHLFAAGFLLNIVALAAIVRELPGSYVWWTLYGLGAATNVLAFSVLNEGFATEFAARANTALNLLMFGGGFAAQWGIGLVVEASRAAFGVDTAGGLRYAFSLVLTLSVLAYAWFAWGWRRHAPITHGSVATANPRT